MALGNLSIKVSADIGGFTSGMDQAAQAARQGMGSSSGSVDDFRTHLLRASSDLQQAAQAMGKNMEDANAAIVSSSQQAADAVQGVSKSIDQVDTRSMKEKIGFAVGAGVGVGAAAGKTAIDAFIEYVEAKLVIAALVILTGITAAVFTTIYLASKAISTISALMDGSFYKSENIDGLIATNKELLDLQQNLRISSIEAGGLNEAMKRLGVDKGDYKSVYEGVTKSIHENGDELDRLGVKYKDQNGKFLESRQVIENVKGVLDGYTEGWDRNAAAAAIGIGSYDKITQVLKVTSAEVQTSKERLDEYQLGVTAGTQKMVADYEQAMREFSRENDLAEQGFKRVFADAVMPLYTDMANMFKEGWPSIVQATRVAVSSIMFLVYSMADGIYIVKESIMASFSVLGTALSSLTAASALAMSGDFASAKNALATGWEDAAKRVKTAGSNIMEQVMKNDRAILLATGNDGRDASIASAKLPAPVKGRDYVARPKDEQKAARSGPLDDPAKKLLQGQIAEQEAFIAAEKTQLATREGYLQYYYQLEYTNAAEYYGTKNRLIQEALAGQLAAYDKESAAAAIYLAQAETQTKQQDARNILAEIAKKRTAAEIESSKKLTDSVLEQSRAWREFDLATTQVSRNYQLSNAQAQFQIDLLGRGTLETAKLTAAKQIDLALEQRLYDIRNKGLPEAEAARAAAEALMQKNTALRLIEDSYNAQRTALFGASEAMRKYAEDTGNQASQVEGALTNAFKGAEDALVTFVSTGKLSFAGLANSIVADISRIIIKQQLSNALGLGGSGGAGGGLGGLISSFLGGGSSSAPSTGDFARMDRGQSSGGGGAGDIFSAITSMLGFANGGDPPVGVASMVGERGPELFVPKQAGTIIPNSALQGMGNNGGSNPAPITITQNFTVAGNVDRRTQQQIAAQAAAGAQRALARNT